MANFSVWRARKETRQAQGLEVARAKRDAVGKLAGGMAHDFNNLLTVVLGNLELARLTTKPGDRAEYIAEAERSAKRGAEMIKQLLAFSRKARLETRTVDVAEIFDGVTPLISNVLGPQHRMICAPVPKGLPKIRVDTGKVQSVLLELFLNARDAMPRGGDIRLEAMETTALDIPTVSLSVQDTGEGIAADRLSLVCDPFYSTRNKATGLGLSMVRGIVEQSGGRLDITSEPGQGTCVTLHFAAATQAVGTLPSEASKLGPHRAAHRLR
nr:ATP-binding protein [Sagittula marina]